MTSAWMPWTESKRARDVWLQLMRHLDVDLKFAMTVAASTYCKLSVEIASQACWADVCLDTLHMMMDEA